MNYISEVTEFHELTMGLENYQAKALEDLWFEELRNFEDSPEELLEAANVLLAMCGSPSRVANVMFDEAERAYSWQISRTLH